MSADSSMSDAALLRTQMQYLAEAGSSAYLFGLFALRELGIEIWIDDFGTGYSSLSYLKQLPISGLKIDQPFVREMVSNENDRAIVTAVNGLAKNLQLGVVAEGVEEIEQLELLAAQNCDIAQGYYFSRPIPCAEFESWVRQYISPVNVISRSA